MNIKKVKGTRKCNCCREAFFPINNNSLQKFCLKKQKCKDADKKQKKHTLKRTPIKKISDKRAKQNKEYDILEKQFKKDNPKCEICSKPTKDLHHKNGRNGDRLTDPAYFMAVCRFHHDYIHLHTEESRKKGWLI